MTLRNRLSAVERAADHLRYPGDVATVGVCDRIERLATEFTGHPPALSAAVEAGIRAAVDREERWAATVTRSTRCGHHLADVLAIEERFGTREGTP